MKWVLSMVFAMLVALFCVDFAPVQKSLVYAQALPGEASAYVDEGEGELKAQKIVACDGFGYRWSFKINKKGKIKGSVQTTTCGVRKVTGTYNKNTQAITLVATMTPTQSCCKSFTYTGDCDDCMTGKKKTVRSVCKVSSESKHTFEMFDTGPDGKEFRNLELVYTRM
jgi:hypothetical protein